MPTREQMDDVERKIEELIEDRFLPDDNGMRPATGDQSGSVPWGDLSREQQVGVLIAEVRWSGFEVDQIVEVSTRVIDGEPSLEWMDGILASDQWKHDKALFAEIREDEWARDHGRLPTPEDMVRAEGANRPDAPAGSPEIAFTDEQVDRLLAEAERTWPANDNRPPDEADPRFLRADGFVSDRTTPEFVEWEIDSIRVKYLNEDDYPPRDEWHLVPEREKYRLIREGSSIDELAPEDGLAVLGRHVDLGRLDFEREDILADTFMLNRELGFVGFKQEYFGDPDALKEWPDPGDREKGLRQAWDGEADLAGFRERFEDVPTVHLAEYRDALAVKLAEPQGEQVEHYGEVLAQGKSAREASPSYDQRLREAAEHGMGLPRDQDRGRDR